MNKIILSLFLVFSVFGVSQSALADNEKDISVTEAHQLATHGEVILIDVRSIEEWEQTGLAANAHPISMHQKGGIPKFTQDLEALLSGDKGAHIALICAGGVRSLRVQNYLKKQGFNNVYNVKEGMVGGWFSEGWVEQGLPVVEYMVSEKF